MNTQIASGWFPYIVVRSAGLSVVDTASMSEVMEGLEVDILTVKEKINICNNNIYSELNTIFESSSEGALKTAFYNARKFFFQYQQIKPEFEALIGSEKGTAFANLRTAIAQLKGLQNDRKQTEDAFRAHYHRCLEASIADLWEETKGEDFQRALLFSSHDLWEAQAQMRSITPLSLETKRDRQLLFSLLQYRERMRYKTSPLSRFTTLYAWHFQANVEDELPFMEGLNSKIVISPNVALLPLLYAVLLKDPVFYGSLALRLNPSLSIKDGIYTWLYNDGVVECFQDVEANPALNLVIDTFQKNGHRYPYAEILPILSAAIEGSESDLNKYLFELLDLGILEWILPENGLSPSWCSNLYQYIGFLPQASQTLIEAAFLLQWLRTASKTMTYQPVSEMKETQENARKEFKVFLEKNGVSFPENLKPEHLFYEDVERHLDIELSTEMIEPIIQKLANAVAESHPKYSGLHGALEAFLKGNIEPSVSFLGLCRQFIDSEKKQGTPFISAQKPSKVGFLLQFFKDGEDLNAVVNAVFTGGGKLMSRWMHLFPMGLRSASVGWPAAGLVSYPWQAWSNANFQTPSSRPILAVPQGRIVAPNSKDEIRLSDLEVRPDETGLHRLYHAESQQVISFNDLGLEDPGSRPTVMQLLAELGSESISRFDLFNLPPWEQGGKDWEFRPRISEGPLIWHRKIWRISAPFWGELSPKNDRFTVFIAIRQLMKTIDIPSHFFATILSEKRAKPQYFNQFDPLSMAFFQKEYLGKNLEITEMLPLPHQHLTFRDGARLVSEMMLEIEV